jgi:hypothetical protein
MADVIGVVSAIIAAIGLGFVILQLRGGGAASHAQATIRLQAASARSQVARSRLRTKFPIHVSTLEQSEGIAGEGRAHRTSLTSRCLPEMNDQPTANRPGTATGR